MEMPNGKREWLAITPEQYHALDAWGSSALRTFIVGGPLEFWDVYVAKNRPEKEDSDAILLGSDFHKAAQYPDWKDRFRILPECIQDDAVLQAINMTLRKNSKPLVPGDAINTSYVSHKRYVEAHREQAAAEGLECVDGRVIGMLQACIDNQAIRELMEGGECRTEVACIYHHPSGLKFKALIDLLLVWLNCCIDFKSTCRSTPNDFLRDAFRKHGYQWQAALYCIVTGIEQFKFISVKSSPSYEANLFNVPQPKLKKLMAETERHINQLASFLELANGEDRDSQGIPPSFHSEGWGAELEFSETGPFGDPELSGYDEVEAA